MYKREQKDKYIDVLLLCYCTESLNGKDLPPTKYTKGKTKTSNNIKINIVLLSYYVATVYEAGESLNESKGEESISFIMYYNNIVYCCRF